MRNRASLKCRMEESRDFVGNAPGLFQLPESLQQKYTDYRGNRPLFEDTLEIFQQKIEAQEHSVDEVFKIAASIIEQRGGVSQPALVMRPLSPLFGKPRFEVRSLDRADADVGRPLFVLADPALEGLVRVGDVVVLSADGSMIIDVDNALPRCGENAVVVGVRDDEDFPYEVELEGEPPRRLGALKWERLEPSPGVGDRVKVMGGIIHGFASNDTFSAFKKKPRTDLDRSDLHGSVPNMTLRQMEKEVHRYFHPESYPNRSVRFDKGKYFLLYGPQGVGKSWTVVVLWSILDKTYNNNGSEKVVFLYTEGSSIEGSLVGSGPRNLRELRTLAKKAVEEGKLPVTFINEAGGLLRDRKVQSMQLDGGSSLSTHEQFLAMLSGPDEIPGILIVDLNMEKHLDEATRQRFTCVSYPNIDRATLVDRMFKGAYAKERDLFQEDWQVYRAALLKSLDTAIGTVLVGAESTPVRVNHLISGRLYDKVVEDCLRMVDLSIYSAREQDLLPLFEYITPSLLYYALVHRAWSLFQCWDDLQAQERLVPDLARPEKARSISRPTALDWHEVEMPGEYDCREILDTLALPQEEAALVE